MPRLIVYGRSRFCPDMLRWRRWVDQHPLAYVEYDIDGDDEAYAKVRAWTGHESVSTLVIASDDGIDPIREPKPLPPGRSPRGVDRGSLLSEPNPGQIAPFLDRHGIAFGGDDGSSVAPSEAVVTKAGTHRPWWKFW